MTLSRTIELETCLNFRDLGGYHTSEGRTVRWRRLFRSDSLHRMNPADVARVVDELGLVTSIDLRSRRERERSGPVPVEGAGAVRALHVPMVDDLFADPDRPRAEPRSADMGQAYVAMLDLAGTRVGEVFSVLADADAHPAVFWCAAGKDRTGVVSALVLSLVGVPDDDVVADYALTAPVADPILERTRSEAPEYDRVWRELPPDALGAPATVMTSMLATIRDRHGSVEEYVASLGVGDDIVASLRAGLLE